MVASKRYKKVSLTAQIRYLLAPVVFPMATQKRKADEMEAREVSAPHECVTIHGGVTELSPIKCNIKKCQDKVL